MHYALFIYIHNCVHNCVRRLLTGLVTTSMEMKRSKIEKMAKRATSPRGLNGTLHGY
jgi:hypothetical protein